jgi:PAS domain S-box-containing protein
MFDSPEQSLRELIQFSPLAIEELDPEGKVKLWNPAAERMFGWAEKEVLGQPYPAVPSESRAEFDDEVRHLLEGATIRGKEVRRQRKDGRLFDAKLWATPIHDQRNQIIGITKILEDITDQKENKRKLWLSLGHEEEVEASLQRSEERMRLAFEVAKIGFWDWNVVTGEIVWSVLEGGQLGVPEDSPANFATFMNTVHPDDRQAMQESLEIAILDKGDHVIEYRVLWPDGSVHWRRAKGHAFYDETGRPVRVVGIAVDIDDRVAADERLLLQAAALEAAANSILIADNQGTILWANQAFSQLTGYSSNEVLGQNLRLVKSGEQDDGFYTNMWATIASGKVWHGEVVNRRKDGSLYTEEMTITPMRSGTGEITHYVAVKQDLTWRKVADEALRQAEMQYRLLFESNPLPMWVFGCKTLKFLAVNEAAIRHYGFSRQEFLAMTIADIRPEEDIPRLLKATAQPIHGLREATPCRHRKKDGSIIDVEIVSHALDFHGIQAELVAPHDVTERKKVGEALRRAEEKYRSIFEDAVIGIFQITPEGRPASMNRAMARMYGYDSPEQLLAEVSNVGAQLFVDPNALQELAHVLENDRVVHSVELEIYGKDGKKKWVSMNMRAVSDADGKVVLHEGTVEDITARKEAGAIQEELSRIIATVPGIVYSFLMRPDGSSAIPFASSGLQDIFDVAPDAVSHDAAPLLAAIHPDDLGHVNATIAGSFRSLTPWHEEFRVNHPKKGLVWVKADASPERQPDGSVLWHGFLIDNTERKQLESQLLQAQKMEAVGRLAGGVSHDFNNIMGIVIGYSDLIAETLSPSDLNLRPIMKIKDAAQRATALISQLLAFSRLQVFAPTLMDLNVSITHLAEMLPRLLGEDIQLSLALDPNLWTVKADPTQIDQVLLNLSVNARDAMPHGGKLVIETHNVEIDESCSTMHPDVAPGPFVMICVSDTGTGISSEVMPHIFDPFFTTKEMGKGTGLGLSTVYGIVRQSGGFILVDTKLPSGTTFKIHLPRQCGLAPVATPQSESARPKTAASKTILLAEDDAALREIVSLQLEELGYTVVAASDGREALRMAEKREGPIDLLLTDVVMPGMSGRQLADKLKQEIPALKVLFVSGYSGDVIPSGGSLEPGTYFAHKPLTKMALDEKLRSIFRV